MRHLLTSRKALRSKTFDVEVTRIHSGGLAHRLLRKHDGAGHEDVQARSSVRPLERQRSRHVLDSGAGSRRMAVIFKEIYERTLYLFTVHSRTFILNASLLIVRFVGIHLAQSTPLSLNYGNAKIKVCLYEYAYHIRGRPFSLSTVMLIIEPPCLAIHWLYAVK